MGEHVTDLLAILVLTIVLGVASFAISVGARVVVHDWFNPALLAIKPLSCDYCMATWSSVPFSLFLSAMHLASADHLLAASVPATGVAFLLLKLKAFLEPPDPVL